MEQLELDMEGSVPQAPSQQESLALHEEPSELASPGPQAEFAAQLSQGSSLSSDGQLSSQEQSPKLQEKIVHKEGDIISEEENFKEEDRLEEGEHKDDDELDFEEGEQPLSQNSQIEEAKSSDTSKPAEDGEVNSEEEELEEGEVKEDDDDVDAKSGLPSGSGNPSVCRFYGKGQCTWGPSCRFIHQEPLAQFTKPPGQNRPMPAKQPLLPDARIPKQPIFNKPPLLPLLVDRAGRPVPPYNQPPPPPQRPLLERWERPDSGYRPEQFPPKVNRRVDEPDFDPNYQRSSRNYDYPPGPPRPRPEPSGSGSSGWSDRESEYERKRRLAFEAAPWNSNNVSGDIVVNPRPGYDRYGQPIAVRDSNRNERVERPEPYRKEPAEIYRDPWRRSKSPTGSSKHAYSSGSFKRNKSDSGSNFSDGEMDIDHPKMDSAHKRRLDPNFAAKHRPSSFKDSPPSASGHAYDGPFERLSSERSSERAPKYYHKESPQSGYPETSGYGKEEKDVYERPKNIPPRTRKDSWSDSESSGSSSSYSGSGSESESNSDREHYNRTNKFESTRPEHKPKGKGDKAYYAEPQVKKARLKGDAKYEFSHKAKSSKEFVGVKMPKSPLEEYSSQSPGHYSPGRASSSRKKHAEYAALEQESYANGRSTGRDRLKNVRAKEYYSPPSNELEGSYGIKPPSKSRVRTRVDYDEYSDNSSDEYGPGVIDAMPERTHRKKAKTFDTKGDSSESNTENGDTKKNELLQQLKVIEEAIARKRSKLK